MLTFSRIISLLEVLFLSVSNVSFFNRRVRNVQASLRAPELVIGGMPDCYLQSHEISQGTCKLTRTSGYKKKFVAKFQIHDV